jgi:type I restriction enzyme M protein
MGPGRATGPSRQGSGDGVPAAYVDFAPSLADRVAIGALVAADGGVATRRAAVREALAAWWGEHATRLAELPGGRGLNTVRAEMLASFGAALLPLGALDCFKLAGVVAAWWTDALPDLKTLIENGFAGVIDGWCDAIADAVEDDEAVGPVSDPFAHKLVLRTMADYLQSIADAKAEIARLKGEKEAFEQSNPPDDADEDELAAWNYAKDLERQLRELRNEHRLALRELEKLEYAASKRRATDADRQAAADAKSALQPVLDQLAALVSALAPYEQIKTDLATARARYRELMNRFVTELRLRCTAMPDPEKQSLVLELLAQDLHAGLAAAVATRDQALIRFIEGLWGKYKAPLTELQSDRESVQARVSNMMASLGYA